MHEQAATLAPVEDTGPSPARLHLAVSTAPEPTSELTTVRRLTQDLRHASSRRYLADVIGSAAIGWGAFALAAWSAWPIAARVLCVAVASAMIYRALMFIHELCHQPGLRIVRHVWHAILGVPALVPLLLYQPLHQHHHSADTYGTREDGEYEQLRGRCRRMALRLLLLNFAFPLAMLLRFGLLGPLGWLLPVVRREVLPRFGHLSMRLPFEAPRLRGAAAAEAARIDVVCTLWAWVLTAGLFTPAATAVWTWAAVLVGVATLNTFRALGCTHLYVEQAEGRNALAQVTDSVNVDSGGPLTRLFCPIGLRFHALHHLAPYLPYHALAEAHRRLLRGLPLSSPYRQANVPSLWQGWRRLVRATDTCEENTGRRVSRDAASA
ncbi:MAG: fatty acid desaturase [Planctomycetes bacterium]|nr:fatty acid desaturase [Planctomycetota bacterium]